MSEQKRFTAERARRAGKQIGILRPTRSRLSLALAAALVLFACAAALAAVKPPNRAAFLGLEFDHFSISLDTRGPRITAGVADPQNAQHPVSGILVVCPPALTAGKTAELHVGFPGAKLRLSHGHYAFSRSYTETNSKLVVLPSGPTTLLSPVKVKVTGVVTSRKLITGTVSVQSAGCSLPSARFKAKFFSTLP